LPADHADIVALAVDAAYGRGLAPIPTEPEELAVRMAAGLLVPAVAEDRQGTLLAMIALTRRSRLDRVASLACGVTMDEGAGRPGVYAAVFRRLTEHARRKGWSGIVSEISGHHTERRRINLSLGARETVFQPGHVDEEGTYLWRSTSLLYLPLDEAEETVAFVPDRHVDVVSETLAASQLGAQVRQPGRHLRLDTGAKLEEHVDPDGQRAYLWTEDPGANVLQSVATARKRLADRGVTAVYLDLPLENVVTAMVGEDLRADGFAYAGLAPTRRSLGLALRLQALPSARISAADAPAPSQTGRRLVDYVLADLVSTGHTIVDPPAIVPGSGPGSGFGSEDGAEPDDLDEGQGGASLTVLPPLTGSDDR
jgi:hypothetical protein